MITRTTTIGTLKNYRYDLNRSNNTMAKGMERVMTGRLFNSFAENPALATRCFQIRHSFMRTNSQLTINDSVRHKYEVAWQALDGVTSDLYKITSQTDDASLKSILVSLNDPDGSGRNALGQSLAAKARSMVQTMNGRYGENYVFAGADHLNVPFTWETRKSADYIENPDPANPDHAAAFQYIKPDGTLTSAEDEADHVAVVNPDAIVNPDPTNPDHSAAFQYITPPDGTGNTSLTNDETLADRVAVVNPDADLTAANGPDNPYYLDKDGNPVVDSAQALIVPRENPDYDEQKGCLYVREDGTLTNDAAEAEIVPRENPDYNELANYKYVKADGTGTNDESEAQTVLCYRGVPVDSMADADKEKLDYFVKEEKLNLDLGLGFKEDADGNAISSSVFNSALQGVYYLGGYGTEERTETIGEGDAARTVTYEVPNNVITVVDRMSQILLNCSPENGAWASDEERDEFYVLARKFEDTISLVGQRYDEMDTESSFLRDNSELLSGNLSTLNEQITELEDVNPAAAISDYMYARYCYDAALKVGNSILSQSLMDYMNF